MLIPAFWCGVIAAILAEVALIIIVATVKHIKTMLKKHK